MVLTKTNKITNKNIQAILSQSLVEEMLTLSKKPYYIVYSLYTGEEMSTENRYAIRINGIGKSEKAAATLFCSAICSEMYNSMYTLGNYSACVFFVKANLTNEEYATLLSDDEKAAYSVYTNCLDPELPGVTKICEIMTDTGSKYDFLDCVYEDLDSEISNTSDMVDSLDLFSAIDSLGKELINDTNKYIDAFKKYLKTTSITSCLSENEIDRLSLRVE